MGANTNFKDIKYHIFNQKQIKYQSCEE